MFVIFKLSNNPKLGLYAGLTFGAPVKKLEKYRNNDMALKIDPDTTGLDLLVDNIRLDTLSYDYQTRRWLLCSTQQGNWDCFDIEILHLDHMDKLYPTSP